LETLRWAILGLERAPRVELRSFVVNFQLQFMWDWSILSIVLSDYNFLCNRTIFVQFLRSIQRSMQRSIQRSILTFNLNWIS
jgi:hypothetical protein